MSRLELYVWLGTNTFSGTPEFTRLSSQTQLLKDYFNDISSGYHLETYCRESLIHALNNFFLLKRVMSSLPVKFKIYLNDSPNYPSKYCDEWTRRSSILFPTIPLRITVEKNVLVLSGQLNSNSNLNLIPIAIWSLERPSIFNAVVSLPLAESGFSFYSQTEYVLGVANSIMYNAEYQGLDQIEDPDEDDDHEDDSYERLKEYDAQLSIETGLYLALHYFGFFRDLEIRPNGPADHLIRDLGEVGVDRVVTNFPNLNLDHRIGKKLTEKLRIAFVRSNIKLTGKPEYQKLPMLKDLKG